MPILSSGMMRFRVIKNNKNENNKPMGVSTQRESTPWTIKMRQFDPIQIIFALFSQNENSYIFA